MHLLTSNMHKNYMAYYDYYHYHHHHHYHYHYYYYYYYYYSVAAQSRGTSCDSHHSSFRAF